jgi:hypothetical protein
MQLFLKRVSRPWLEFSCQVLTLSSCLATTPQTSANDNAAAAALGPPISGPFKGLTDEIFPTSQHHLSDRLSFSDYYQWKRKLSAKHGIDFIFLNSPIFQVGTVNGKTYLDNEMDLYLQWRVFENERTTGKLFFWGLWVQTFTDRPSGAFAQSQDLFTFPNGGATDPNKSVVAPSALWWEQSFQPLGLTYRLGQLYASSLWGSNDYLGDDRATFMNTALGGNQGAPWASGNRGLGAMATLGGDSFYVSLGFQDAKGDQQRIDFNSFGDGQFMYLGELGVTPTFAGKHKGIYKIAAGYVDATGQGSSPGEQGGRGIIISAQQDIGDDYGLFGIFRHSWDRYANNTERAAGAGVMLKRPFGWADDRLGVAAFYAKPYDDNGGALGEEYGLEAFWRFQLTPRLDLTPDLQLYLQPGRSDQNDPVAVFGLRLRYIL